MGRRPEVGVLKSFMLALACSFRMRRSAKQRCLKVRRLRCTLASEVQFWRLTASLGVFVFRTVSCFSLFTDFVLDEIRSLRQSRCQLHSNSYHDCRPERNARFDRLSFWVLRANLSNLWRRPYVPHRLSVVFVLVSTSHP